MFGKKAFCYESRLNFSTCTIYIFWDFQACAGGEINRQLLVIYFFMNISACPDMRSWKLGAMADTKDQILVDFQVNFSDIRNVRFHFLTNFWIGDEILKSYAIFVIVKRLNCMDLLGGKVFHVNQPWLISCFGEQGSGFVLPVNSQGVL